MHFDPILAENRVKIQYCPGMAVPAIPSPGPEKGAQMGSLFCERVHRKGCQNSLFGSSRKRARDTKTRKIAFLCPSTRWRHKREAINGLPFAPFHEVLHPYPYPCRAVPCRAVPCPCRANPAFLINLVNLLNLLNLAEPACPVLANLVNLLNLLNLA